MKRFVALVFVGVAGAVTAGCPIYSDQGDAWCADYHECRPGEDCSQWPCNQATGWGGAAGAYYFGGAAGYAAVAGRGGSDGGGRDGGDGAAADVKPDALVNEAGEAEAEAEALVACGQPADCPSGATCGTDGVCHAGDCGTIACINGFVCESSANGRLCAKVDPRGCESDAECAAGASCVDGVCTPAADLCSDRTQCVAGSLCVNGKCVVGCGAGYSCPDGYLCRFASRLCNIVSRGCSTTADCGGPNVVCVDHACVPRCNVRGPCGDGTGSCVNNGCIPSQKIVPQCAGEGVQAACGAGQICLHRHCYTACGADGGGVCTQPDQDVCKAVTTSAGTFSVCGSTSNLGSECDPTMNKPCSGGQVCLDGFCRPGL
jgi:hypothetical protein